MNTNRIAGLTLIALPILFNIAFALLQQNFQYPDILREPPAYVLEQFAAGGSSLVATWYVFMLSAVLFVPAAILLGRVLEAGFEQLLVLTNPVVSSTGDIIDTYVYRVGLIQANFSLATAVGLFKSFVGMILVLLSYWLAARLANYRIF